MAEYKFKEITEKIIGIAMRVHATLGNACLPVGRVFRKSFINGRLR